MDNRMSNKTGKCVIFVAMFDYPQDPQNYQKRENPSIDCLMHSWANWNLEGNPPPPMGNKFVESNFIHGSSRIFSSS